MRITRLAASCAVLVALLVGHGAEHALRHDTAAPAELGAAGLTGTVAALAVLVLALTGSRSRARAPGRDSGPGPGRRPRASRATRVRTAA